MTLFAICLGGVVAWATAGAFSFVVFFIVAALGRVVQVGLCRLKLYLPWMFAPLLVIVVYWTQAGWLGWPTFWPAIIVAAMCAQRLPLAARFGNHGYMLLLYGILLIGVAVGGIPVWSLLCLLPAPRAWRAIVSADKAADVEWEAVTGLFFVTGYLIKGLIR